MIVFLLGLLLFLGVHSVSIIAEPWRDRMVAVMGKWLWKALYSLAAIAGFVLLVIGYGVARPGAAILYQPPTWLQQGALLLMVPVFPLLAAAYLPGRIKAATRHPMLIAVKLWALAHLLANGTLVDVILFSSFFVWAVIDRISLKHRTARAVPAAPACRSNDAIAVAVGLILYFAFIFRLHQLLIGVPPV